jgi:outer membrane protein OmpA-like peptidoglycan-associated protein
VGFVRSQRESFSKFAEGLKNYLEADPQARIRLEGNADPRGTNNYNEALAERRVEIVKNFLVGAGVPAAAIETRVLGESQNLDLAAVKALEQKNPNKPPVKLVGSREHVDWLAHNRRVDIVLIPGGQVSSRYYPYAASDFEILWQAPRPSRKRVEQAQ